MAPIAITVSSLASHAVAQPVATEQTSGTTALLIAVSPVNENVVWASGTRGTWLRTTDGGSIWQTGQVPGADSLQFRDVHAVDASTAYLLSIGEGSESRIYRTTDAGRTWTLQFTNPDSRGFYDCFDFWDARRGLVIGDAFDGVVAMLSTTDGATWGRLPPDVVPSAPDGEFSHAASGTCRRRPSVADDPGGSALGVLRRAPTRPARRRPSILRPIRRRIIPMISLD